ncbi:MAG: hypothetical protein RSG57_00870, partial [Christensenellaceae bacterium]
MIKKILTIIMALLLVFAMGTVAFAEETPAPTEAPTQAPTEAPTPEPTQAPTHAPTPAPTKAPTPEPTQAPTQAPTQTPIPSAQPTVTVVPTEQAGAVNIVMYIYDQGKASKGYKVTVDETSLITDENGKVEFKNVTVESHKLIVKSPDGVQSVGMVYLSRGDDTAILDQAMGGKYEISVARNTDRIYLNMEFQGENALQITSASNQNTQPAKPSAIISSSFKITAEFLDKNGKPMSNLGIQVVSDMPMLGLTDSKGYFVLNGASFTTYNWAALANGVS